MAKDMQSKTQQTTKRNRITFPDLQGVQREIYLSAKYDDSVVENFRSVVNALVRVRDYGGYLTKLERDSRDNLFPDLRKKLIEKKLIEGTVEERALTLSQLIEEWFEQKVGIDPETETIYRRYSGYLEEYFGSGILIPDITHTKANGFTAYLLTKRMVGTGILKNNTVHRCFRWVTPLFDSAVDAGYLTVSPFANVKNVKFDPTQSQEDVSLERIGQAIAACADNREYRLAVALGGYQGFRPGEMNDLTFDDFKPYNNGILIRVPDTGKTGTRDVPMFPEFLPHYEEALKHRKEGQKWLFPHCRKDDPNDFRNIATPIRKKLKKAGVKCWRLFFDSLRGSCITRHENSKKFTSKQMTAMFGNSEPVRQSVYVHGMKNEDYAALGGLYDPAALPDEPVKKSPLISPFSGRISDFFSYLDELAARRMTFSDLCKMLCKERGFDEELFNQIIAANPVFGKLSSFVNSFLVEAYDDTPRKVSWFFLVWRCGYVASKTMFLFGEFYRKLTVPQKVLQEVFEAQNGEDRIRTCGAHTGSRI